VVDWLFGYPRNIIVIVEKDKEQSSGTAGRYYSVAYRLQS
jgi:hypothetical protein